VAKPIPLSVRKRRRGNPNWFVPDLGVLPHIPSIATEFEMQVERLGLTKAEYVSSAELRRWCARNRNRVYVPEWLLEAWGMPVEETFSGVA
jgi:hypothetical protein